MLGFSYLASNQVYILSGKHFYQFSQEFIYFTENWDTGIIATKTILKGEERKKKQKCERNRPTPETAKECENERQREDEKWKGKSVQTRERTCENTEEHVGMVKGREERRGKGTRGRIKGEDRKSKRRWDKKHLREKKLIWWNQIKSLCGRTRYESNIFFIHILYPNGFFSGMQSNGEMSHVTLMDLYLGLTEFYTPHIFFTSIQHSCNPPLLF